MKTLLGILLITSFTIPLNAQKKSQFNEEQLKIALVKAKTMKRTGAVMTMTGGALDVIGIFMLDNRKPIGTDGVWGRRIVYEKNGGGWCLLAGIAITAAGIPLWITGGTKKKNIDNKLATFKVTVLPNAVGIKIRF